MSISEPMGDPADGRDNQWQPFQVRLKGTSPEAAKLQVTLSLVQPEVWQDPCQLHVYSQDITGSVFWDDLRIYRLPRVRIRTDLPGNVFPPGATPRLRISVQGLEQVDSGVLLTIRDAAGVIHLQQIISGRGPDWQDQEMTLPLEKLEAGLYEAELMVSTSDQAVTRRTCRFICLADVEHGGRGGLGLYLADLQMNDMPAALALAKHVHAGAIKLSAWMAHPQIAAETVDVKAASAENDAMLGLLTRVRDMGMTPELVLDRVPADIAGAVRRIVRITFWTAWPTRRRPWSGRCCSCWPALASRWEAGRWVNPSASRRCGIAMPPPPIRPCAAGCAAS